MPNNEFELIDWIRKQSAAVAVPPVPLGIGDDMGRVKVSEPGDVLVTSDTLLDGVHFQSGRHSYPQIGRKALAVSLSDAAAMAALPVGAVLSVALDRKMTLADAKALWQGAQPLAQEFACPIIGGDTTSWPHPLALTVTLFADPNGILPVLRSGARVGDAVCLTGTLGGSLAGKHLSFQPRVREARLLAEAFSLHAMIDISDGLAADLNHICKESKVGVVIIAAAIPVDPAAAAGSLEAALHDGEDFELLFTLAEADAARLAGEWKHATQVTRIGTIVAGRGMQLKSKDGKLKTLAPKGYRHVFG